MTTMTCTPNARDFCSRCGRDLTDDGLVGIPCGFTTDAEVGDDPAPLIPVDLEDVAHDTRANDDPCVPAAAACPECGEDRVDELAWDDDGVSVTCRCGHTYDPDDNDTLTDCPNCKATVPAADLLTRNGGQDVYGCPACDGDPEHDREYDPCDDGGR